MGVGVGVPCEPIYISVKINSVDHHHPPTMVVDLPSPVPKTICRILSVLSGVLFFDRLGFTVTIDPTLLQFWCLTVERTVLRVKVSRRVISIQRNYITIRSRMSMWTCVLRPLP